jgi:carbamoyltransferase
MAGFGQPTMVDLIRRMVRWDGSHFELDQSYFDFFAATETHFRPKMVELLGQPRMPEASFAPADDADSRHYADIAASVQRVTEEIILSYVDAATRLVGIKRVAMAGGVALNSLANGRIQRELGVELYVQPSAGDAGGALGAALAAHCQIPNTHRPAPLLSAYLGQSFTNADAVAALKAAGMESYEILPDLETTCRRTAELLRDGAVIGWFQGRFEWGPRALGARSILANPALPDMQRTINEKIKFREPFRPFAPAVLAEKASRYFEIESERSELDPESFMLSVAQVRSDARADIPAVTHVDGTARVQLVWERSDSAFRRLLEHFDTLTGLPVLLNTSFNRRGEPIVSSPADALKTFTWSGLDCLVMGNVLVHKEFF